MTLKCDCGKELKDWRGAQGHVKFNADETHGPMMQKPDGWRDLFTDEDGDHDEPADDAADEDGDTEDDPTDPEEPEADSDESEPSESNGGGRLKKAVFEDIRYTIPGWSP